MNEHEISHLWKLVTNKLYNYEDKNRQNDLLNSREINE